MDNSLDSSPAPRAPRWAIRLVVLGTVVSILAVGGLIGLPPSPADDQAIASLVPQGVGLPLATATPARSAEIQRELIAPVGPTAAPAGDSPPAPGPTQAAVSNTSLPPPAAVVTALPPPLINWTQEEKYALSWLCWFEIRGFGARKMDACLSVISTVRVRYAYPNSGFGVRDVLSTLRAPGQFTGVNFDTTRPATDPDLLAAVEQYQTGARGSCNGYPYFDSLPGGPMTCVIRASNGQWMEFHRGR